MRLPRQFQGPGYIPALMVWDLFELIIRLSMSGVTWDSRIIWRDLFESLQGNLRISKQEKWRLRFYDKKSDFLVIRWWQEPHKLASQIIQRLKSETNWWPKTNLNTNLTNPILLRYHHKSNHHWGSTLEGWNQNLRFWPQMLLQDNNPINIQSIFQIIFDHFVFPNLF